MEVWHTQTLVGLVLCVLYIGWRTSESLGKLPAAALTYFFLSAVMVYANPWYHEIFNMPEVMLMDGYAAFAMSTLFVIFIAVGLTPWNVFNRIFQGLLIIIAINSFVSAVFGRGIFHANSIDASIAAIAIHLVSTHFKEKLLHIVLLMAMAMAIIMSGGTTGIVACAMGFMVGFLSLRSFTAAILAPAVMLLFGRFSIGTEVYQDWGRYEAWRLFMSWWRDNAHWLIGSGLGTFEVLASPIQQKTTDIYVFMHNEYLQILFDTGIIGLLLALAIWFKAIYRVRTHPVYLSALASASVVMLTQSPLRFFVSQLFIAMMVFKALYANPRDLV
jgi:O-antigen ligase